MSDLAVDDLAQPPDLAHPPDLARSLHGCADGTREGFVDEMKFPRIAGCAGGFRVPGVLAPMVACGRAAGNGSMNPSGLNCAVEDLCAPGWHVCASAGDVFAHAAGGCAGAAPAPGLFFITRQSSNGCSVCATGNNPNNPPCDGASCVAGCAQSLATANDVFGCGSVGDAPFNASCAPLDRFGNNLCQALPASWTCGADGVREAANVIHLDATAGGALCCQD